MARHAKKTVENAEMRRAFAAFREVVESVERAKEALVAAAPGRRGPGVQLAEALWAFETGIEEAQDQMAAWRTAETEQAWRSCVSALNQSARSAADLRLGAAPEGYEELYARLAELIEPLEAFGDAARRFRQLGW
ncbi:MAG TPA: hypothetical protein VHI54_11315 [Actinomycetota bacterium]|nr:hypothetical protein [Actinomycetota bacterium]